jgi:hypothetical protein
MLIVKQTPCRLDTANKIQIDENKTEQEIKLTRMVWKWLDVATNADHNQFAGKQLEYWLLPKPNSVHSY